MEQSSPAPNSYNIPQKTQIQQNKNYYNTTNNNNNNYNSYDPYYAIYDEEIYGDVGKFNESNFHLICMLISGPYVHHNRRLFKSIQQSAKINAIFYLPAINDPDTANFCA